jgi:hypothetical protein
MTTAQQVHQTPETALRDVRRQINDTWQELHRDGVDWNPTAMRLLSLHTDYLAAAYQMDRMTEIREGFGFCRDTERGAEQFVKAQREQLSLVSASVRTQASR